MVITYGRDKGHEKRHRPIGKSSVPDSQTVHQVVFPCRGVVQREIQPAFPPVIPDNTVAYRKVQPYVRSQPVGIMLPVFRDYYS